MTHAVELEKVRAGYEDTVILSDISVRIPAGKITVILGGSGCGKSTLLKTILRLTPALGGSIRVLNHDITRLGEEEYGDLLQHIGVLFQNGALLNSLNLGDNVATPLDQHTRLPRELIFAMVRRQLDIVGLGQDLYKFPGELSGGMRKRAALARALILNPSVLFCDEPSAGLDPVTAASLDQLLLELRQQYSMSIIVVTHELASIRRIADELIFLHDGSCVYHGSLEGALHSDIPAIQEFFGSA